MKDLVLSIVSVVASLIFVFLFIALGEYHSRSARNSKMGIDVLFVNYTGVNFRSDKCRCLQPEQYNVMC